jgi:hypothetical protein
MKLRGLATIACIAAAFPVAAVAQPAASFTSLTLKLTNSTTTPERTISLKADGTVRVTVKKVGQPSPAPIDGNATPDELAAVRQAFASANVATLPPFVPDNRMLMGNTSVELDSTVGNTSYTFRASIDFYGAVTARVKPLVDALSALETRLQNGTTPPAVNRRVIGIVVEQGGKICIEVNRFSVLEVTNEPFVSILSNYAVNTVRAYGKVTPDPAHFGGTVEVEFVEGRTIRTAPLQVAPGPGFPTSQVEANAKVDVIGAIFLGLAPAHTNVALGEWFHVRLPGGRTGWVPAADVQIGGKKISPLSAPPTAGINATVTGSAHP